MLICVKFENESKAFELSKLLTIGKLKEEIKERFDLDQKLQRLIFKGKQLEDDHTLFNYSVNR